MFLPYGGIYLTGGVTNGIKDFLINDPTFKENFFAKGRLSPVMDHVKVMIVDPNLELGLMGSQECARREMNKHIWKK